MMRRRRTADSGFTLIELVVVLAILGILLGLAIPSYLGARRNAFVPEADETLNELKTLAWAYYQQHGTWVGLTSATLGTTFGFQPPADATACWDFSLAVDGTATEIQLLATGDNTPAKCTPVDTATVTLTLQGDGSASRAQVLP